MMFGSLVTRFDAGAQPIRRGFGVEIALLGNSFGVELALVGDTFGVEIALGGNSFGVRLLSLAIALV